MSYYPYNNCGPCAQPCAQPCAPVCLSGVVCESACNPCGNPYYNPCNPCGDVCAPRCAQPCGPPPQRPSQVAATEMDTYPTTAPGGFTTIFNNGLINGTTITAITAIAGGIAVTVSTANLKINPTQINGTLNLQFLGVSPTGLYVASTSSTPVTITPSYGPFWVAPPASSYTLNFTFTSLPDGVTLPATGFPAGSVATISLRYTPVF